MMQYHLSYPKNRLRRLCFGGITILLALFALTVVWRVIIVYAQGQTGETQDQPTTDEPTTRRERQGDPETPLISFIDTPSPTCYQPIPKTGECYIQWGYMHVAASSSQYIISMTVHIDGRLRAYYGGFFQTSMDVPLDMHTPGFRVFCGQEGASGIPGMGKQYNFIIQARETGGLKATNYGAVTCPAGVYLTYLPQVRKR